ncbi:MAG: NADPH-dependent glutamate synthase [Bacilli bacterium]|nr:NADPH-dependent glutamate synthase [Bacilli bacterium]
MNERVSMSVQDKLKRINNFDEVELGFSKEEAIKEASRCLNCKNPMCTKGCPVGIEIPKFIEAIKNDDINLAYEIIKKSSNLPSICGRVCPQESQCEGKCIRGLKGDAIAIGALERYVADQARINNINSVVKKEKNGKSVAIVGSGPAGLSCAGELVKEGFDVTIYEALHKAGGVLIYGIPEFRLPKEIVDSEVESLKNLGVKIECDIEVGTTITLDELRDKFDYVFIGTGAGLPKFMEIDGIDANGVFSANEILTRINLMGAYKKNSKTPIKRAKTAYVIGGGNVAMDAVRSLKRLGIDAHIMYRRSMDEMPARKREVEHAKEEGIIFDTLQNPKKIVTDSNNNVIGMEVVDMELSDIVDGRRSVIENNNFVHFIECDMVVMALGTSPNSKVFKDDLELDDKGLIIVDDTLTSIDGVYAGGDITTGSATVILAMEAGKRAAKKIIDLNN